jgi:hypothetical protein
VAIAILAVGGMAILAFRHSGRSTGPSNSQGSGGVTLSEGTIKVLSTLRLPLDIRFYAVLDPATTSEALRGLATRIDGLLSAYEAAAPDKVRVTRYNSGSAAAPGAASADGLKPFNLDKGDACYLGIVIEYDGRKELLTQLAPEWEPALESDLSRAIERVSTMTTVAGPTAANSPQLDRVAREEVQRIIPDVGAVSLDQGRQMLRDAALQDLKTVVSETEAQVHDAQQKLTEAQKSGSEAEQKAAMKNLQEVQLRMGEKVKEVGERSQAQIRVFEQMKSGAGQ